MSRTLPLFLVIAASLLTIAPLRTSRAADVPTSSSAEALSQGDGWAFAITPYLWGAGLSGQVAQPRLPEVDLSPSFGDILRNLDFAGMVLGEARKDRVGLFADMTFVKVTVASGTPYGVVASDAKVMSRTFSSLVGGEYAVFQDDRMRLSFSAGLRVWRMDTRISFRGGVLDGAAGSGGATWVDGLAGLRGRYVLGGPWFAVGWGMVGGGQARLDWDTAAGIGYNFTPSMAATIGYRAYGVDYRSGGFVFDIVQHGPIAGLTVRF